MVPEDDSMDCSVIKNSRLDKTFTIKKVKAAFRHMGAFKSAGPDGIKPIVMKHFGPRALGCITNIYQAIYSTGYIPTEFRKSRVVFIPKPQKDDYGEAGSFRPISLTQYLFKTMECVIEWSLREHSDDYGQISDMQHAYSGTKGTDTALSTLVNMIESAILRKHLCLVISVDIQGAFNNLATQAIHKVMVDNNYPPFMIRWYMNFLKTRISIAEVLGVKLSIRPVCGTPQGGVLSSRIWNLAFDPLLKLLNQNSPCAPVGFADDGALCFRGICADTLVDMAQPKIDQAIEWGAQNGLSFSVDKTTVVFFSRENNFHKDVLPKVKKIQMNGVEITPTNSMKYLGVVLDHKLSWTPHIQEKVSKAIKFLHLIKPAINHIYGLDPKRMQWIWKQVLLPRLTYGCHVWGHSLTHYHKSLIKTAERHALAYYAPMWKTTPTASLQIIINKKPSHLEVRSACIRTYMRIKNIFQNPLNFWDDIPNNKRMHSHLATLKHMSQDIIHDGTPLDVFESDHLKEPTFSWNPPILD